MKNCRFFFSLTLLLIMICGCSSNQNNPIQPSDNLANFDLPSQIISENQTDRSILGTYSVTFDLETFDSTIQQAREIAGHMKVTPYLPFPGIVVTGYDSLTGVIDLDITINNPYSIDGYDLRLIIFTDDSGVRLKNPDDWTDLWDIPGGSIINPFKSFAKDEGNRLFAGMTNHSEHVQIYMPSTPNVTFAIDASFPGNCAEPYEIGNFNHTPLYDVTDSEAICEVDVFDWQDDVTSVQLYCPSITGTNLVDFEMVGANRWRLNLINSTTASAGNYTGVIIASSEDSKLYDIATICITNDTLEEWSIFLYITEDNLGDRVQGDINELEVVGSVDGVLNMIVCWDKDATTEDVILKIERDPEGLNDTIISPVIDDFGEVIPPTGLPHAKASSVGDFLTWGIREFPAKNYGVIILGHGNGPFRGMPGPEDFLVVCGGMNIWDVRNMLQGVMDEYPEMGKFDFVNLVSCVTSWIEIAYCLKDVCDAAVASEWLQWANSFEYSEMLAYIVDNVDSIDTFDICEHFVYNYLDNTTIPSTLAAWDSSQIDTSVIPALNDFSIELINALPNYRSVINSCRTQNGKWGAYCNEARVKDLGLFADHISQAAVPASLADAGIVLRDAIEDTMIAHGVNPDGTTMCPNHETGWQIWFPTDYFAQSNYSEMSDYHNIGFDATYWDDFLAFFDLADPDEITYSEFTSACEIGTNYTYHTFTVNASSLFWNLGRWYFNTFDNLGDLTRNYIDPMDSQFDDFRLLYPLATWILRYDNGSEVYYLPSFWDESEQDKCQLGQETISQGPGNGIIYDPALCSNAHYAFGDSEFSSATASNIPNFTVEVQTDVVGWGEVLTELGTYDCLLVRSFSTYTQDSIVISQTVNYSWLSHDGVLVASVSSQTFDPETLIPTGTINGYQLFSIE